MTLSQALYTYLSTHATVTAQVSTRIYPDTMPQSATLPAVVYERGETQYHHTMGDTSEQVRSEWYFYVYASTHLAAITATDAISSVLEDYSGTMGGAGGVAVTRIFLDTYDNQPYDPDVAEYGCVLGVVVWAQE